MSNLRRVPVGIVGASGYGALQLLRLLMDHPEVEVVYLASENNTGKHFSELYPHLAHVVSQQIQPIEPEIIAQTCEVIFLCLPNGLACKITPQLLEKGSLVLDLSADYRFSDVAIYTSVYGIPRTDNSTAAIAVYGLPELYRDRIAEAQLVSCPGCYPTASLLALSPLLKQGLITPESAIVDAKSGISGGGRQAKINLLLAEADNTLVPYNVTGHHHTPEIEQICSDLAGHEVTIQFTPHAVPMVRGILATVYATLRDPGLVRDHLITIYKAFYRSSPWVRVCEPSIYPQTKWTYGSNLCYIGIEVDTRTGRVIVFSAIDNLIKGEAGQAIQCMNIMKGWDETLGLPKLGFYP